MLNKIEQAGMACGTFFNLYKGIGSQFAVDSIPVHVDTPKLLLWNEELYKSLVIDLDTSKMAQYLAGNIGLLGCRPRALAYSGHQFGYFNPVLGDGRAHYLGSFWKGPNKNETYDLQLKGSGATIFARGGDGLCPLGPAVREFIMSKAIAALRVPTTHCLSVVTTGAKVYRDKVHPGAVVCRVASSHIRIGSFQYLSLREDVDSMRNLMELAISRHYHEIEEQGDQRVISFLRNVCQRQLDLTIEWMRIGFVHGVMNTDNCLVSGETIDYGPCAMLDDFGFDTVFSSIDTQSRYAFGKQPNVASWNCARLADALEILMSDEPSASVELRRTFKSCSESFNSSYEAMWAKKLGILQWRENEDPVLLSTLLTLMEKHQLDYTNTFAALTFSVSETCVETNKDYEIPVEIYRWVRAWRIRINEYDTNDVYRVMKAANPALIPRNSLVEAVISEFETSGKSELWEEWSDLLGTPYEYRVYDEKFTHAVPNKSYRTFCGT